MEDEILDESESLNYDESQDFNTEEKSEAEIRAEKAEKKALDQELRAKKLEKELKELKSKPKENETPKNNLTLKDIRALSSVHDDDVDDVLDYAEYKGISPAEALKTPAMKATLKAKEEERKTAQASNTGGGRRGTSVPSDESILQDFKSGKVSENDDDIARLAEARFNQRISRVK